MAGIARDTTLKKIKRLERNAICKVENEGRVLIVDMLVQSTTTRVTAQSPIARTAKATVARIVSAASASARKNQGDFL